MAWNPALPLQGKASTNHSSLLKEADLPEESTFRGLSRTKPEAAEIWQWFKGEVIHAPLHILGNSSPQSCMSTTRWRHSTRKKGSSQRAQFKKPVSPVDFVQAGPWQQGRRPSKGGGFSKQCRGRCEPLKVGLGTALPLKWPQYGRPTGEGCQEKKKS
jgi:hypothetical protein